MVASHSVQGGCVVHAIRRPKIVYFVFLSATFKAMTINFMDGGDLSTAWRLFTRNPMCCLGDRISYIGNVWRS